MEYGRNANYLYIAWRVLAVKIYIGGAKKFSSLAEHQLWEYRWIFSIADVLELVGVLELGRG